MSNLDQKLKELREEYAKTPYNKATNKHLGILRKKIANTRQEMQKRKKTGGSGFAVKKTGDATAVLVGFPNVGKSSLIRILTNAESEVADYAFTTLSVIPGMLEYKGTRIQIMDVPGLIEGASLGKGGGSKVASVMRVADLLLIVVDINHPEQLYKILNELYVFNIRVNKEKPRILVERKTSGGIVIDGNGHKIPEKREIVNVLAGYGIYNAALVFYQDSDTEDLIETVDTSMTYIKGIVLLNKIDTVDQSYIKGIKDELERSTSMKVIPVSAELSLNLDAIKREVFERLNFVRVYLKPRNGSADFGRPLILRSGSTVFDVARALHSKSAKNVKYAYINGRSVKFENQKVGKGHVVGDEDVLTLVYERA